MEAPAGKRSPLARPEDIVDSRIIDALSAMRTPVDMVLRVAYLFHNSKIRTAADVVAIPTRPSGEFDDWFLEMYTSNDFVNRSLNLLRR